MRAVRALDGLGQSGLAVRGRGAEDEYVHGPAVVSPLRSERVRAEEFVTDTETNFMRMRNLRLASRMRVRGLGGCVCVWGGGIVVFKF